MARPPGPWRSVLSVLVAIVVVTATLLVLFSVPVTGVQQSRSDPFEFTMTQSEYWYFAPSGYPCPGNASGCTASNFFAPPSSAIGPGLAAFSWSSERNSTVQFEFFDPQCTLGTGPTATVVLLYSANASHGGFALESNQSVECDEAVGYPPVVSTPWWQPGPLVFVYSGAGPVLVTGTTVYTVPAHVPIL